MCAEFMHLHLHLDLKGAALIVSGGSPVGSWCSSSFFSYLDNSN